MARFNQIVDVVLFHLLAAALAGLVAICFLQVVMRYVFAASFTWAEEISIILMLWAAWGAACLALKQGAHLRVRLLEERLGQRANLILRLILYALAIPFLIVITVVSRTVLEAMDFQTLMSLPQVPMNVMYYSVPFGSILMIYYLLRLLIEDVRWLRSLGPKGG